MRLFNIDFFRFIFTLSIIFYHLQFTLFNSFPEVHLYRKLLKTTWSGDQAVEFFFIISGFFIYYTFKNASIFDFIKKKIIRLWPVLFFCFILKLIVYPLIGRNPDGWNLLLSLFFLDGSGWNIVTVGETWFVSVLFWVSLFYYYLLKNFDKKIYILIIALLTWFSYSFELHANVGGIRGVETTWGYIFNSGILRGSGGIGLGFLIAYFIKDHLATYVKDDIEISSQLLITIGIIESFLLLFVIAIPLFIKNPFNNIIIVILAFTILFILFVLKRGFVSVFFNKKYWGWGGKYTFSIYLTHLIVIYSLKPFWDSNRDFVVDHPVLNILLAIIFGCFFGIFVYHTIEVPGASLLKKILFKDN